ncbi:30S ribosomal protein S4 [Candidatus Woesearchaeota archaeon]|nr:30S ribosomal protein S4 [Candidatus Woesearchaeota archaeon]
MGDPKKFRKKYETPAHPWNKTAIEEQGKVRKEYGLKNRREILRVSSFLRKYKKLAKKLIGRQTEQGEKEKQQIMGKLFRLGLLKPGAILDDILGLQLNDVMDRRLQSIVYRKGFARTMAQARQFITHRHVLVGDNEITTPTYLVSLEEEAQIRFKENSTLASEEHPERARVQKAQPEEKKKEAEEGKKETKEVKTGKKKEEKEAVKKEEEKTEEPQAEKVQAS